MINLFTREGRVITRRFELESRDIGPMLNAAYKSNVINKLEINVLADDVYYNASLYLVTVTAKTNEIDLLVKHLRNAGYTITVVSSATTYYVTKTES